MASKYLETPQRTEKDARRDAAVARIRATGHANGVSPEAIEIAVGAYLNSCSLTDLFGVIGGGRALG